jgi:hypothetical protein
MNTNHRAEKLFGQFALAAAGEWTPDCRISQADMAEYKAFVLVGLDGELDRLGVIRFRHLTRNLLPVATVAFAASAGLSGKDCIQNPWTLVDVRRYWQSIHNDHLWDGVSDGILGYCPRVLKARITRRPITPQAYLCEAENQELLVVDRYGVYEQNPDPSALVAVYRGIICDLWDSSITPASPPATVHEDESGVDVCPPSLFEDQRPING